MLDWLAPHLTLQINPPPEGMPDPGKFEPHFSPGSLALYTTVYLCLMSIGAGLAIPGGLFMPSIVMGAASGGMWGILVRMWMPKHWNVQPGLYAMLAATGVLGGVFRWVGRTGCASSGTKTGVTACMVWNVLGARVLPQDPYAQHGSMGMWTRWLR